MCACVHSVLDGGYADQGVRLCVCVCACVCKQVCMWSRMQYACPVCVLYANNVMCMWILLIVHVYVNVSVNVCVYACVCVSS